ncbi:hypothetical protein NC998_20645 [Trichocoleus desertorum GB2-A4]|uniref:Uncharacterized protein n=2 Tax=Trichocoleusaceae TaxID=2303527 RepID=A0ABV0JCL3_9CYAN
MTAHVAGSTQIDSAALIEAMNFRTDVVVLTALVDEEWRSPAVEGSREESLPLAVHLELLSKLLGDIETKDVCHLLKPYILQPHTGSDQFLVQPLGLMLAEVFYSEEYLYEAISQGGFLDADPLKLSIEQRPDILLLAALTLDETFADICLQPYIQRLLNIEPDQIKHHAKIYGIELDKAHWAPINTLLQQKIRELQVQIEVAYRSSLNPCSSRSFESILVLQVTQFRLNLDIALGDLFSSLT